MADATAVQGGDPAISIRLAGRGDLDRIRSFYQATGRSIDPAPTEVLLVAEDGPEVVAAVRLCEEEGVLVLRTMRVAPAHRRRGLGSEMLRRLVPRLRGRECYCIPYAHLKSFYGGIGFQELAEDGAPPHLRDQIQRYRGRGDDMLVMLRPASVR